MPPPWTHTPSSALLLWPDTRQVILISFSSNGLYRTSARLSGTCPTVVASFSPPFVFFIFTNIALCVYALGGSGINAVADFINSRIWTIAMISLDTWSNCKQSGVNRSHWSSILTWAVHFPDADARVLSLYILVLTYEWIETTNHNQRTWPFEPMKLTFCWLHLFPETSAKMIDIWSRFHVALSSRLSSVKMWRTFTYVEGQQNINVYYVRQPFVFCVLPKFRILKMSQKSPLYRLTHPCGSPVNHRYLFHCPCYRKWVVKFHISQMNG